MSHVEMQYVTYYNDHVIEVNGKRYAMERTCRMKLSERGLEQKRWRCSGCRGITVSALEPEFCPQCGAKVIKED